MVIATKIFNVGPARNIHLERNIIRWYKAGFSVAQVHRMLGHRHNRSLSYVYQVLARNGVSLR